MRFVHNVEIRPLPFIVAIRACPLTYHGAATPSALSFMYENSSAGYRHVGNAFLLSVFPVLYDHWPAKLFVCLTFFR